MFGPKLKIDKRVYRKLKMYAELAGYSSPEEFVNHLIEKELAKLDDASSKEEVKKRLKGLGYIS